MIYTDACNYVPVGPVTALGQGGSWVARRPFPRGPCHHSPFTFAHMQVLLQAARDMTGLEQARHTHLFARICVGSRVVQTPPVWRPDSGFANEGARPVGGDMLQQQRFFIFS